MKRFKNWLKPAAKPNQAQGTLIGHTIERHEPVYLSQAAHRDHTLLLGKVHTGKTALMTHLVKSATEPDSALIVIDTDGDLLPLLRDQVPADRLEDVTWLDFCNREQVPGWNLLDQTHFHELETVVSNFLHIDKLFWPDDGWRRLHERTFRLAIRTLGLANRTLAYTGEIQFTLADIPYLFTMPTFRRRVLNTLVHNERLHQEWWQGYENLSPTMQFEAWYPGRILIDRLVYDAPLKNILTQPRSTFDLCELLRPGSIVFINLGPTFSAAEHRYWLGALLADHINWTMLTQKMNPELAPASITMAIHGLQPIPLIEQPGYLAELQKRGVHYIFTRLSMSYPYIHEPSGMSTLLCAMNNLMLFYTTGQDAQFVATELDEPMIFSEMRQLPDHQCLFKTRQNDDASSVMRIQTLPPLASASSTQSEVLKRASLFSRSVEQVKAARAEFEDQWYGREFALRHAELAREVEQSSDSDEPFEKFE